LRQPRTPLLNLKLEQNVDRGDLTAENVDNETMESESTQEEGADYLRDWTPEEEKRMVRKMDFYLIPIISILYLASFLDRANIGNARLAGLEEDIGLTDSEYAWSLSIFFFGYILFEIPSNVMLKRLGIKIWIPLIMVVW